jgi:hypothetical protein
VNRFFLALGLLLLSVSAHAATISVGSVQITEGQQWCIPVTRTSGSKSQTASFTFRTINGTAIAPADYIARSGSQSVRKGTNKITICGTTNNDTLVEPTETFQFSITAANANTIVQNGIGTITILDNDVILPPPPTVSWIAADLATADYMRTTGACATWPEQTPITIGTVFARLVPGPMAYPISHWAWGYTADNRYIVAVHNVLEDGSTAPDSGFYIYMDCVEPVKRS